MSSWREKTEWDESGMGAKEKKLKQWERREEYLFVLLRFLFGFSSVSLKHEHSGAYARMRTSLVTGFAEEGCSPKC